MHRFIRTAFVVLAGLAIGAPLAFAQNKMALGKKGEIEFTSEARLGSTTLKAGHYQFQHVVAEGQHYLVVRERPVFHNPTGVTSPGGVGKEVARVACRIVPMDGGSMVMATALYTKKDADGVSRITRINIQGEHDGHVVMLEPQS